MILLLDSLNAWQSETQIQAFRLAFKQEVTALDQHILPLQQGLSLSSYVSDEKISPIINKTQETPTHILVTSGIFYTGIIAGCSCADDPGPLDTQNEYCEVLFSIDKKTAQTSVHLIAE